MFGTFTPEQGELRKLVRSYVAEKSPESEVRRVMETVEGYDPGVWAQMANELGLQGLAIPEEYGGNGFGWGELGIVLEELGRALVPTPFYATVVLAASTILESGDEGAKQKYLPLIASGELTATVALTEANGRWDDEGITITAEASDDGWTVTGDKHFVIDGHTAGLIIVPARTSAGISLFAVDGDAAGVNRTPSAVLDLTRKLAVVSLVGTRATLIGTDGDGARVLARVRDLAAVGLAMEQVGGAQQALDMSIAYMKMRVQFGQPIGAFQALKHMAADVLIEVESARSAAYYALDAAVEDSDELPAAAALAKAYCSEAYVTAAHQNIQFHGGMGFTWEVPAHLYFKRARASEVFLGDADAHREALASLVGI